MLSAQETLLARWPGNSHLTSWASCAARWSLTSLKPGVSRKHDRVKYPDLTASLCEWLRAWPTLFALALAIRLPGIGRPEVGDESFAVRAAEATLSGIFDQLLTQDSHPPLYFLLLRLWATLGHDLWWLRMLSATCGALTCLVVYRIGSRAFGEQVGRYAYLFAALSPLLIFNSQYLRPYALATLFTALSVLAILRFLQAETPGRAAAYLFSYALLVVLSLYTYYLSLFSVIATCVFLVTYHLRREPKRLGQCLVVLALAAAAYMPWLPYQTAQMQRVYSGVSSSTSLLKDAKFGFYLWGIHVGGVAKAFLALLQIDELQTSVTRFSAHHSKLILVVAVVLAGSILAALVVIGWRTLQGTERVRFFRHVVIGVSLVPPLCAALLSVAGDIGIYHRLAVNLRYFGESAAMFTLVLAGGVAGLRSIGLTRGLAAVACVLFAIQISYIYQYPFNNQRKIFEVLDREPNVMLLVSFPTAVDGFFDTDGRRELRQRFQQVVISPDRIAQAIETIADHQRFFLFQVTVAERMVQYPTFGKDFESALRRHAYVKATERQISDLLSITVYERAVSTGPSGSAAAGEANEERSPL